MVAFLEKSMGSAGFHQIIDFLNRSHICYALTKKPEINATIDGHTLSITEGSLRRHLKLADQDGITSIPNSEIFEQLALMGYHTDSDKLTFQKGAFSPQWRFLIHNILHCLSPKKTAWEQFSSNIAAAVICLATNRKFNFSRMIFEHMVSNISSPYKFLMYRRFIQICLDMQRHQLQQHTRIYHVPSLSMKVFNNMKRPTKGFSGQEVTLFPTMLDVTEPSTSPSRIISLPSHSPTPSTSHSPEPSTQHLPDNTTAAASQPSPTQPSPTHPSLGAEHHVPTPYDSPLHAVHSHGSDEDDEVFEDDSSKQGRKLSDAEVQEKASTDTELFIQEVTPTEVIQDQEGSEKASDEVSTVGAKKGTTEEVPIVSTAEVSLSTAGGIVTYTRRSAEKRSRQDKGKAIMIEEEPKKKTKKELEQERLSYAEAIRLEEQMNEEQRAQIARDEEIARQWDEEERQRAMDEAKSTKKLDWNDPSVIRYHTLKMKPKTVAQARINMIKYLKNQGNYKIKHGSEKQKSPEKIVEEEVDTQEEMKEVAKETRAKRKKSIPRKKHKEETKDGETFMYYQVFRGDGSSKNYKVLSEMLEDFDRLDVEELFRLVKERYSTSRPEGYDLMLWGDLHILFEPDEDDEIWKDQHEYNLISWRLCDFCGIHILLMENGLAIHMLTEKKYPLSQEMISKMLKKKLKVDHESSRAIELLRFIISQVQK
ncbi:hypothetical protein Tco_0391102 [Tanacetum coccineum]